MLHLLDAGHRALTAARLLLFDKALKPDIVTVLWIFVDIPYCRLLVSIVIRFR